MDPNKSLGTSPRDLFGSKDALSLVINALGLNRPWALSLFYIKYVRFNEWYRVVQIS